MFHELVDDPGDRSPEELLEAYAAELRAAVEAAGVEAAVGATDLDRAAVEAVAAGDAPDLDLADAAALLALREGAPPADAIAAESRDALLMGMTNAVLDVERLESGLGGELEAREIQSKVEGRFPMTLREFALLHGHIQSRTP